MEIEVFTVHEVRTELTDNAAPRSRAAAVYGV